jgi:hydroxymethylpyrimidine/phosphomethylpyrimidine kinase
LARGKKLEVAVTLAKQFITQAIRRAFPVGAGHGPVHHFHRYWKR